jgi:fatty acid desaturase
MLLSGTAVFLIIKRNASITLNLALIFPGALWYTFWLQSYTAHFHESAHYLLAKSSKINDFLSRALLTPFVGLDVVSYRMSHWQHHLHLGETNDTETSYRQALTLKNFLASLSGYYLVNTALRYIRIFRGMDKPGKNLKPKSAEKSFLFAILYALSVQFLIIALLRQLVSSEAACAWAFSFFVLGPSLSNLRQTLEHRSLNTKKEVEHKKINPGAVNRMFGNDFFSRNFGGAGFNRHLLHHWDPTISYSCFDQMEAFLMNTQVQMEIQHQRSSYWKTFKELFEWT